MIYPHSRNKPPSHFIASIPVQTYLIREAEVLYFHSLLNSFLKYVM